MKKYTITILYKISVDAECEEEAEQLAFAKMEDQRPVVDVMELEEES